MAEMKADKYFYGHEGDVCKKNSDGSYAFFGDADTEVLVELNALQSELSTLKQAVKDAVKEMKNDRRGDCGKFLREGLERAEFILRSHGLLKEKK